MKNLNRLAVLAACLLSCAATGARAQFTEFNAFKEPSAAGSAGAVSGPDLKATADKFDGGKVTIGGTAYVVATFKNNGTSPVKVGGINLYPSSTVTATVNMNKCSEGPLPPEAVCAVTVAVTGLQLGAWRVEALVDHDGRTRLATTAMTGEVSGGSAQSDEQIKAEIEASPADLDFGSATGGSPLVRAILLRNRTSDKVAITSIKLDAAAQTGFTFRPECPESLMPGESCVVNVTWSPVSRGVEQGVLRINHTAKSSLTKVDIKGAFAPDAATGATLYPDAVPNMGLLVSDTDRLDFGTGVNSVSAMTLSLVNKGSADLTLKSITLAGSDNGISVARAGCRAGLTLKPVEACALTVNWVPSRAGAVLDDIQVTHTGARGILILPIRGTADAAATRGSIPMRQTPDGVEDLAAGLAKGARGDGALKASTSSITPVLDGYVVTSHSPTKAVINGPVGSLVVRDGEDVVISGVKWTVTIVSTGVILSSDSDEMLLVFDRALRSLGSSAAPSATPAAATATTTAAPATSTPAASAGAK